MLKKNATIDIYSVYKYVIYKIHISLEESKL